MSEESLALTVGTEDQSKRVDQYLAEQLPHLSRSRIQKEIAGGALCLNARPCLEKRTRLQAGDLVEFRSPQTTEQEAAPKPQALPLVIVYEDDDILVVDKPRGLVVHPGAGNEDGTLVNALLAHVGETLREAGDAARPGIVHRIDKDTSGLLVCAKTAQAYESLRKQFDRHDITRQYDCLVYGNFAEDNFTIDRNLERDPANRLRYRVTETGGRRAVTHLAVLERFGNYTLLRASLETGRTHQIRVHMASIGHPVLGDPLYGPRRDPLHLGGQILHARLLGFLHPTTGAYVEFTSDRPEYFRKAVEKVARKGRV
ncbi:MAG: RluA family pseudouridine synthase [Firmicutes bacterium]|nr:RluA family pseudouridine synthase [Bacillota bacterium]